jgi:hypothetical protein
MSMAPADTAGAVAMITMATLASTTVIVRGMWVVAEAIILFTLAIKPSRKRTYSAATYGTTSRFFLV